ncbi:patatin-like phospholipase family protein [Tenacibaculum sp. M341]|uniref:patatin-like phospholipase family protein n=1 Tax=Tenacibaculum sp. M341 TaxID=2530339 RepID=UPI00104B2A1E|nr:patatin-like phospholipase family protein [Tenacibaculum sp. M341]TCI85911.1 patatin [Tenacibaculum sp. M341]
MKKQTLLLLFLLPTLLFGQTRPKVGLVLSGGGAKGFAHVRVLKEIEKIGLELDYIGGTSMGAIIGGMYASGYSAAQIETIVKEIDFLSIIQDNVPREQKPYFEKAYLEKTAITLPVKKGSIGLPLGLSKGQNILNFLTELLSPVDKIEDFSKLPIPFFCIGTNIETGKEVLFEKGSLPLALRASASFPSLLNPVEVDGQFVIDGGVANNFPVDRMREKGIDIIIGVNVQGTLLKKDELTSVASLLSQIVNFKMYEKSDEQVENLDIHIHPDINDYTVVSFEEKEAILDQGTKAMKPYIKILKELANKQNKKFIKRGIKGVNKRFLIDRIVLKGNKNYTQDYILGKLGLKEGDSISYKGISQKINALSATKNFQRVDYTLKESFNGKKLELIIKENEIKTFLGVGLHYDLLYKSGVLLNYNHKKLLFSNDEFSVDVVVGDRIRYDLQYFIDNGFLISYGISSSHNSFKTDFKFNDVNVNKINVSYRDFTNRFFAQSTFNKRTAFGLGFEIKDLKVSSDTFLTNNEATLFDESVYFSSFAFLHIDTYNKKSFPTKGFLIDANFKWYMFADFNEAPNGIPLLDPNFNQYSQIDGKVEFATTFWDKFTLQSKVQAGFTLGEEDLEIFDYRLGGYNQNYINNFIPFYGYDIASFSNQSFLRGEFNLRYQLFNKNYIETVANYGRTAKNVLQRGELLKDLKSGYAIGYGIESFFGPVQLKYSWSPDHKDRFWLFNLGFWF